MVAGLTLAPARWRSALECLAVFVALVGGGALSAQAMAGGTGLVAELEDVVLRFTWPPLLALATLLAFATWRPLLPSAHFVRLAIAAWWMSAAVYAVREGIPDRFEDYAASLVVTAAPIVAFLLLLQIGRQLRLHRWAEAGIGGVVALLLSWVAAFLAVGVGCAAPGACP